MSAPTSRKTFFMFQIATVFMRCLLGHDVDQIPRCACVCLRVCVRVRLFAVLIMVACTLSLRRSCAQLLVLQSRPCYV